MSSKAAPLAALKKKELASEAPEEWLLIGESKLSIYSGHCDLACSFIVGFLILIMCAYFNTQEERAKVHWVLSLHPS